MVVTFIDVMGKITAGANALADRNATTQRAARLTGYCCSLVVVTYGITPQVPTSAI